MSVALEDPWVILGHARDVLEEATWTADFVQTYVPAGFASGERETGTVSLALPGNLRWDYAEPFPKVFLVRLDTAWTWNPEDASGRRSTLAPQDQGHLALLRLDIEELRTRYAAESGWEDGTIVITLEPSEPDGEIRDARVTVDAETSRLLALAYDDVEGNRTEFRLSGHRRVDGAGLFEPPADVEWLED